MSKPSRNKRNTFPGSGVKIPHTSCYSDIPLPFFSGGSPNISKKITKTPFKR